MNNKEQTPKQIAKRLAKELNIEMIVECRGNRIDRIELIAPEGFNFEGDRHYSCSVYREEGAEGIVNNDLWEWIIEELEIPLEKCDANCVCKE